MSKIILATGTDQGFAYEPYLATINKHSQVDNYLICVDFWPHSSTRSAYPNINYRLLRRDQIDTDVPVNCVQNGDFLKVLDLASDDVIIFTDGDVRMQRPFNNEEIEWLQSFRQGEVSAQYNAGPHDTLWWDCNLIGMKDPAYVHETLLDGGKYADKMLYNVGVVVCTAATYAMWHKLYVAEWDTVKDAFTHQAKQQWLMCLLLYRDRKVYALKGRVGEFTDFYMEKSPFTVKPMPYTLHTHGCFALPEGCGFDEQHRLLYKGEVVLFRHNVRGAGW